MNVFLAEDDILIAEHLKDIILSFGYNVVGMAHNKKDAIEIIDTSEPDVALLDINMQRKYEGIEIGEYIQKNYNFPIIYITAHSEKTTIEKALKTKPSGYIIKPFKDMEVFSTIQIAFDKFRNNKSENFIILKDGVRVVKLYSFDILFVKSDKNYIEYFTKDKRYIERKSLGAFLDEIKSENFIQIHRSYAVNIDYVILVKSSTVLIDNYEMPISRKYKRNIKMLLKNKKD